MDISCSINQKNKRMIVNILSIFVVLAMAFPVTGGASAQEPTHKVGLVVTESGIADNGFNFLAYQGLQRAQADMDVTSSLYTPADQNGYGTVLQQCADDGNELCIAVGFPFGVSLANAARANPETRWAIVDWSYPDCWDGATEGVDCGSFTEMPNVRGLRFNEKQAGYLAGVLAGAMTTSDVVGAVGGMEIPPVVAFVEGYRNGAQCTNPRVNVLTAYTGTFSDPGLGATTAQEMITRGADVIFGAAGSTGDGAIMYSAQNDRWAIGVDADQYLTVFGNGSVAGSGKLLSSAMKRVDNAVYQTIADFVNGTFSSGTTLYELATNGVGLAPFHETDGSISQEIKDKLETVRQGIIDGMVNIDACPWLIAFPENDAVEGWEWPDGAVVTLTIDNAPGLEWSGTAAVTTWGDPRTYVRIEFGSDYNLKVGDVVTLSDEFGITLTHTVQNLSVTNADVIANVVGGTADSEATVQVWPHETGQQLQATAMDGNWQVDFTGLFDVMQGTCGRSQILIGQNATAVDWCAPKPSLIAFPENDAVEGWEWPEGATVTLTINNAPDLTWSGTAEVTSWGDPRTFVRIEFGQDYNLQIGDEVTLTDGTITRIHTVQNLAITKVNPEDDLIKGVADPGVEVHVWPHATGQEQLATTSPKGKWNVDFSGVFDLAPGECGRSQIFDEVGEATAVDWCVPNPRIVASITEDWFYLQEFSPDTTVAFTVYQAQGGMPIWKGSATTDASGFAWINAEDRWNLEPGSYLVVKDGSNRKDLVIEGFTFDTFNLTNGQLSGTAPEPYGRKVWVGIGWQNDSWSKDVNTDETGAWLADFGTPVPSDYQWVAAQIFDADGDATELRPDRVLDLWVAAYTYDPGTWTEGMHTYHFEATWNGGSETSNPVSFNVSEEAQSYDGYALLRPGAVRAGTGCEAIDAIDPNQSTRFLAGYVTDYAMAYEEALAYFDSLTAKATWDDGQSAELARREIIPFREDSWFDYVCTLTADLVLANQPDWVNSGITVDAGQSFRIEAFGLMNPCSDTYPNGDDICIFYTPVGAEWVVPYENQFGIFPGPGLRFMALLGRISDGEPFNVGAGGTFTAGQAGMLWFTPNDNLRTDNQGAYSLLVRIEP